MTIVTTYEIGDRPWMMIDGEPQQVTVVALNIVCKQDEVRGIYLVRHGIDILEVPTSSLYPTREELLSKEYENIH